MRILFATARTPFPPHEGDQLIAWEQLRRLGARHQITLLTLDTDLADEGPMRAALAPFTRAVHVVPGGRDFRRLPRGLRNRLPMMVNLFYDRDRQAHVDALTAACDPDLVHVQTIHMAEWWMRSRRPKVLDMVDALSFNMRARVAFERFPKNLAYALEARWLRGYEERALRAYDRTLLVSADDAVRYPDARARIAVNPNGTAITRERLAARPPRARSISPEPPSLVFHGTMRYFPNVDAAGYFARGPFLKLAARRPGLRFVVVGRAPRPEVLALARQSPSVVVTGEVPDMVAELGRHTIAVFPLRTGSGMKNKVIEALACGLPVVASPEALTGLGRLRPDEHLLMARDEGEWVAQVTRLLDDPALAARLGAAGQAAVLDGAPYSWDDNAARLEALWTEVVAQPATR